MNSKSILAIFAFAILLVPLIPAGFSDADEAHSIATNYILSRANVTDDEKGIPIVFSAVDGNTTVIGIDPRLLINGTTYTESQVQEFLGITSPIEIKYLTVIPSIGEPMPFPLVRPNSTSEQSDSHSCDDSNIFACYFYSRYIEQCLPIYSNIYCHIFASITSGAGYDLPTSSVTSSSIATISDTTPPVIMAPTDISIKANHQNPILVSIGNATATDNSGSVTITNDAPSMFDVGDTTII